MKIIVIGIILAAACAVSHAGLEGVFAVESPKYGNRDLTGVTLVLTAGIEEQLTLPKNVKGIQALDFAVPFDTAEYDYLYMKISLHGDFGFEGIWHGYKLARKKKSAADWKRCELYTPSEFYPLDFLDRLHDNEILGVCGEHYEPSYADLAQKLKSLSSQQDRAIALEKFRSTSARISPAEKK